jgi:hypothetical protein
MSKNSNLYSFKIVQIKAYKKKSFDNQDEKGEKGERGKHRKIERKEKEVNIKNCFASVFLLEREGMQIFRKIKLKDGLILIVLHRFTMFIKF